MNAKNFPNWKRTLAELSTATNRKLIDRVAVHSLSFFKERFRQQNWIDHSTQPWPKRRAAGWGKRERKGRGLLIDTGRLRRSIRIVSSNGNRVVIGTNVPYAQKHNEGFKGKVTQQVKAHTRSKTKFGVVKKRELKRSTSIDYGRVKIGDSQVKAHSRSVNQNIPKRQFIGQSAALNKQVHRIFSAEINRIMKKL